MSVVCDKGSIETLWNFSFYFEPFQCGEPVGVYRALKDATTERDAAGERWFTADNHWTMIHDIITGGRCSLNYRLPTCTIENGGLYVLPI